MTYEKLLRVAIKKARKYDKEEEAVKLLMVELSRMTPSEFYLSLDKEAPVEFQDEYLQALDKYLIDHIPIQHLIGYAYFYGYKFVVNKDVLIPRSETEELVSYVLSFYDSYFNEKVKVLDLGTGSGCIGLTLDKEEDNMDVTVSDISKDALIVVSKNQENLNTNCKIILSDLFNDIKDKFDIIVSNPPYIPDYEDVMNIVKREPSIALFGGIDGIRFYEKILVNAYKYLNNKFLIAFEHGYQQKEAIYKIAKACFPNANIIQKKDMQGKDRFTFIGSKGVLINEKG